ncbi:tetraacyldisaccharide 4'-kinase [bacterium]|nr:tetraacyldisaccharide 4'-kinase [bacterium]
MPIAVLTDIWRKRDLSAVLWPLSLLYGAVIHLRNAAFDRDPSRIRRLPAFLIALGNITVGGTGKTPAAVMIGSMLRRQGLRVGILSRGYGRTEKDTQAVSDGSRLLTGPEQAGDEPVLLSMLLPDVPVLVGADRVESGRLAVERFGCNALILDDAFQHRCIARDLNLVLIDAVNPWGNGWMLPAGPLREPVSSLKRADAVLLARADQAVSCERTRTLIRKWTQAPVFEAVHQPVTWVLPGGIEEKPLDFLDGRSVFAFAGIGHPESFLRTLEGIGVSCAGFKRYGDHHPYSMNDLRKLAGKAFNSGASCLVTTEKDGIRLPRVWNPPVPVYCLRIRFEMRGEDRDRFHEWLVERLQKKTAYSDGEQP